MSVYTKQVAVATFPAYVVFEREAEPRTGFVNITAADTLGLDSGRGYFRRYSPGSCASYALEYNECPIAAYERAVKLGHPTHWINACSTVLSDSPRAQEQLVRVTLGMRVLFEGRKFTIEAAPNNNLRFAPIAE